MESKVENMVSKVENMVSKVENMVINVENMVSTMEKLSTEQEKFFIEMQSEVVVGIQKLLLELNKIIEKTTSEKCASVANSDDKINTEEPNIGQCPLQFGTFNPGPSFLGKSLHGGEFPLQFGTFNQIVSNNSQHDDLQKIASGEDLSSVGTSASSSSSLGHPFTSSSQRQGLPYTGHRNPFHGSQHHHHVGSAPSGLPLQRNFGYFPYSPDISLMSSCPSSWHGIGLSATTSEYGSPNLGMMSLPGHGSLFLGNSLYAGTGVYHIEGLGERGRSRTPDNNVNQKFYQLDLDKINNGEDTRTTLMIKNIPNKYTSDMVLAAIDETHQGTYDFFYLPIDSKNMCNVGYAFINMVSPSHIVAFYKAFNGKKWEKSNSEKVASLAYARIQGKAALVMHFQKSGSMIEDTRCWPILFYSEGQDTSSDQELLSGNLKICIHQTGGSFSGDKLESPKRNSDENLEKD